MTTTTTTHRHKLRGHWYDEGFIADLAPPYLAIEVHDGKARIGETLYDLPPRVIYDASSGEFRCEDFGTGLTFGAREGERERIEALYGPQVFEA